MVGMRMGIDHVVEVAHLSVEEKRRDHLSAHIEIGFRISTPVDEYPHSARRLDERGVSRSHVNEMDPEVLVEPLPVIPYTCTTARGTITRQRSAATGLRCTWSTAMTRA